MNEFINSFEPYGFYVVSSYFITIVIFCFLAAGTLLKRRSLKKNEQEEK